MTLYEVTSGIKIFELYYHLNKWFSAIPIEFKISVNLKTVVHCYDPLLAFMI